MSIVVTGATGQLGRLVIEELLTRVPAAEVAAAVRDQDRAADLAARGVELRTADYDRPETLADAIRPGDTVLLISGNEIGRRTAQHGAVIDAAQAAGAARLVYTGVLGGPDADFRLADEHKATERLVLDSGLPYTFLRNGWYTENYTALIPVQLEHGVAGSTAGGRVGAAGRADYAAAAAEVLTGAGHEGRAYELSGDRAWTLAEYAAELSRQSGRPVAHHELPAEANLALLTGAGLPRPLAEILVDVDVSGIARGLLAGGSGDLARLIGRPTTPLAETVARALAAHAG
ncbi:MULTISPECIES: NAD(P)H-binding protein [Kitasatospora]|uniref:Putative oxidoreductase n=1 Tax=Kitasatospora setae (strain ATCC 33774 / DSM 43861 / JCM 3304 / KCC A-0304 / NBRC 14216 / KM-6054) TaxID=452652 RepID=E4NJV1_KITSK|nr:MULTISPECIES: NAD(P)H-binding protein [Kitasatospora]BAJ33249.1 putative oxidoreductase [Kitasatospora setae KM-6054]